MPQKITIGLTVMMVTLMLLTGFSCAGDQQARGTEVLLKGALTMNNQFVDEAGQTYELAINDKTEELLSLPQQLIEIKAALMEQDGRKTLSITEITPANQ